jgi:hypothetical protein
MGYVLATVLGIVLLAGTCAGSDAAEDGWVSELPNGDYVIDTGFYRLKLARKHGYAGVEVRIHAATGWRLDQYWTPEYMFAPMCRFFDNIAFTGSEVAEIQGYVTMKNTFVEAEQKVIEGHPALVLTGNLQRRSDEEKGAIKFVKTMVFLEDHYDAVLSVTVPEGAAYRYADVWWDVNDDWSHKYENSAGDWIHLRDKRADCPCPLGPEAFRTCEELNRGYGMWMAVSGPRESILITSDCEEWQSLPNAGMSFFDGDEEKGPEDEHSSHSCMSLDLIGGHTKPVVFEPRAATVSYSVYFIARSTYSELFEPYEATD